MTRAIDRRRGCAAAAISFLLAVSATAQTRGGFGPEEQLPPPLATAPAQGRIANAGNGEIGQRLTREQAAPNINPLKRIESRIANRVQNRIRSRIDTHYDPQANAASPFRLAGDQARTVGRSKRH